jgi:hypothetical protein
VGERPLARRKRVTRRVPRPSGDDGVGSLEGGWDVSPLGDDRTPDHGSGAVAHRTDRVGTKAQPRVQHRGTLRGLELVPQRSQRFGVPLSRPLDTERVRSRGEHRLPHERVVDEEEEVRGESVEVTGARPPCLVLEVAPRGRPQLAEPLRFESAQPGGNGGLHRIVQPQPFRCFVDEAERPEPLHRVIGVLARHGLEDTSRHSARNRCNVEESATLVIEAGAKRRCQRPNDPRSDLVDRDVGDVCLGGEPKRQGVATRDSANHVRVLFRHIRVGEKSARRLIGQPNEREDLEPAHSTPLGRPFEHRRFAPGDDEAQFRRQRRNQLLAQPGIGDAEHLIGVDEHDASGPWLPARRVERGAKARLRRIDGRAVDPPHLSSGPSHVAREGVQQRRLADTRDAIDERHTWPIRVKHPPKGRELALPSLQRDAVVHREKSASLRRPRAAPTHG